MGSITDNEAGEGAVLLLSHLHVQEPAWIGSRAPRHCSYEP